MGNFYVNYTLKGAAQQAVAETLRSRHSIVTPPVNDAVIVFDAESDGQDQEIISRVAKMLSSRLNCTVLAILNHDDDILWYQLYAGGDLQDEYDSCPGYFDDSKPAVPTGGDAKKLCSLFGSAKVEQVEEILRDEKYAFAFQRHQALVEALGISGYGVCTNYGNIDKCAGLVGLPMADVIRTG